MRAALAANTRTPVLDEAVWLLRATTGDGRNEGSAGTALNPTSALYVDGTERGAMFSGLEAEAATCPDAAAIDLTTGFVVWVDMAADGQPALPQQILAKPQTGDPSTNDCYAVGLDADGHPFVEWQDATDGHNGPAVITANGFSTTVTFPDGVARRRWGIEWLSTAQGYTARYYTGTPDDYTLVSEVVNTSVGAQTITTSTDSLRIGDPFTGVLYRVRLYGTLGGACLRDFYPQRDWISGVTMTSATGEVWSNLAIAASAGYTHLTVPDDSSLDVAAGASAAFAFRFTQPQVADTDGDIFVIADRSTGTFGVDADGFRLLDILVTAFASDAAGAATGDGVDFGFLLGAHWAAGTHTAVINLNRANTTGTLYVDGTSHATADISAVGALDPAAALTLGGAVHHGAGKWDRILTAGEIAAMPTLLG